MLAAILPDALASLGLLRMRTVFVERDANGATTTDLILRSVAQRRVSKDGHTTIRPHWACARRMRGVKALL
jgi:hypothetical protein